MNNLVGQYKYPWTIIRQGSQTDLEFLAREAELTKQRYLNDPDKDKRSEACYWKMHTKKTIFKPFGVPKSGVAKFWVLGECVECHNLHWMYGYNFTSNHTRTCPFCKATEDREDMYAKYVKGKEMHPRNPLQGMIFGDALVNDKNPTDYGNGHALYECTCLRCQKIFFATDDALLYRNVTCCDECKTKRSNLEEKVASYLKKYSISYTYEMKFEDLRGVGDGLLSYDFFIEKNNKQYAIEVQGEQHYKAIEGHFNGQKGFEIRQEHDKRKKEYALNHGFIFIEIPYTCKNLDDYLIDII